METNRFPPSASVWLHIYFVTGGFIYHLWTIHTDHQQDRGWQGEFHINSKFQWDKMELRKYEAKMCTPESLKFLRNCVEHPQQHSEKKQMVQLRLYQT